MEISVKKALFHLRSRGYKENIVNEKINAEREQSSVAAETAAAHAVWQTPPLLSSHCRQTESLFFFFLEANR